MANEENIKINYPPNARRSDVGLPPIIHHVTPKYNGVTIYDNNHVYANCRCPVDTRYGLMINLDDLTEHEKETGECYIHCDNCGADIILHFKPSTKALLGHHANIVSIDEFFDNKNETKKWGINYGKNGNDCK